MRLAGYDLLAPGALPLLALLGMRITGLMLIAPVFSSRSVSASVRAALVVLLTLALAPAALGRASAVQLTPATLLSELLVGFAVGMGAAVLVGAAEAAGDVLAIQSGLSSATALDPVGQTTIPVLGEFARLFVVTLLLASNGHLLLLRALASSMELVPTGGPLAVESGLGALIALGGSLFTEGIRFAAPVVAAVLISNIALGILGRAAPQLNVLTVAFPLQIGVGLLTLGLAIPYMAGVFADWPALYEARVGDVLNLLAGRGR